jgi:hypothetical protein
MSARLKYQIAALYVAFDQPEENFVGGKAGSRATF